MTHKTIHSMILNLATILSMLAFATHIQSQESISPDTSRRLSVAWSPDGTTLAAGGGNTPINDGQLVPVIELWDISTGQLRHSLQGHSAAVLSVTWNPDGTKLASGSVDGTIIIWDVVTGQPIHNIVVQNVQNSSLPVVTTAWSPDGTKLASGHTLGETRVWDVTTGQELVVFRRMSVDDEVTAVAWSPDGTTLASSSEDGTVMLWNLESEERILTLDADDILYTLAWSSRGELASGGAEGKIQIWNVSTGQLNHVLDDHQAALSSLVWSPDGILLSSSSRDGTINVWNTSGELLNTLSIHTWVYSLAYSPFGGRLAFSSLPANDTSSTDEISAVGTVQTFASGAVQIIVPAPSLERLQAIADACNAPAAVEQSLTASIQADQLGSFVAQVEALPENTIPPACAADLIAVAEALQNR